MTKKKRILKIDPNNYWETCNTAIHYEYGGKWHSEPPKGRYTKIRIDWYKDADDNDDDRKH